MTDKEILTKAIQKAIEGGFDAAFHRLVSVENRDGDIILRLQRGDIYWVLSAYALIFNHDFAKALWGEGWAWFTEGQSGDTLPSGNYINWKGHSANMVVAEYPIKYLGENI